MTSEALLGIDLGTSGVKTVLLSASGEILGEGSADCPLRSPRPGWAEADPSDWWRATVLAVGQALASCSDPCTVRGVGVDGQMHGVVLTDRDGDPVRPALLWPDQRATEQAQVWGELSTALRNTLGNPIVPGMAGPLLTWLTEHEPEHCARARHLLSAKDWLRMQFTGSAGTDPSDASGTLLWDIGSDRWADRLLDVLNLDRDLLPPVAPSGSAAGTLRAAQAAQLGLPAGIPVAVGAADTAAALLATGLAHGEVQLTIGSGAQLVSRTDDPTTPPQPLVHLYRTAEPQGWYRMAAVQNAGLALDWVRGVLGAGWDEVYAAAGEDGADSDGVIFVPYLTGERTPRMDPTLAGGFTGLRIGHHRGSLLRAAVEGVAFAIRDAAEALPGPLPGPLPDVIRLAGGGIRDRRFRALVADVMQVELAPVELRSASAVGAAMLAASAAGLPVPQVQPAAGIPVRPSGRDHTEGFLRYRELVEPYVEDEFGHGHGHGHH
ncbi:xylulokinase [Actinoalloteichus hymeniacidonis]|uniref:Xylulose kinase n=1 Tax=Actinoalloteichus hymeniacidonis TaxID=340345 RepID=A0AAC9HQH3_9PSEU|nr:xylulokinase [Actinoalloteichus hymeniacidonis]AOS62720.1 D-xylulose kinase [Actinoalloteichus hymeniacidonis]MBB5909249.1 xylulokinase [Actinoalloteichus hymeniacidonis]